MSLREHLMLSRTFDAETLVEKAEAAFDSLEEKHHLLLLYESSEDLSEEVSAHVFREVNTPSIMVSVVDDRAAETQYLVVQADDQNVLSRMVQHLEGKLPVSSLAELRSEAEKKLNKDPELLVRLAVAAAPKFDQATFDLLVRGLHADNENVREAAAMAVGVTQWKEFAPEVQKALATETSSVIKRLLEAALQAD